MRLTGVASASDGNNEYFANVEIRINKIINNKFDGYVSVTGESIPDKNDIHICGDFTRTENYYLLTFDVDYYETTAGVLIDSILGMGSCIAAGNGYEPLQFDMTCSINSYPRNWIVLQNSNFDYSDMQSCMLLSSRCKYVLVNNVSKIDAAIIGENNIEYSAVVPTSIYNDNGTNTLPRYSISSRKNNTTGNIDVFLAISFGGDYSWQGNTEFNGTEYPPEYNVHYNFNIATTSIETGLAEYYTKIQNNSEHGNCSINLYVTGYSRGAGIANLFAKKATDVMDGTLTGTTIPQFDSVTAYTFGTPNVAKASTLAERDAMTDNYPNIFNICFEEDLVSAVPFSNIDGWGYWKYGQTVIASGDSGEIRLNVSQDAINALTKYFDDWGSVSDFYNLQIDNDSTISHFDFIHQYAKIIDEDKSKIKIIKYLKDNRALNTNIYKLAFIFLKNSNQIETAHLITNYNDGIKSTDFVQTYCSELDSIYNAQQTNSNNVSSYNGLRNLVGYNSDEVEQLVDFANYEDNNDILNWDLNDPSTWDGITWNSFGRVEAIELPYLGLEGSLDVSGFTALESLNVSANNLTAITMTGCSSMEELDCSFNQLSALDLRNSTNWTSVICCYNYLDIQEYPYNTQDYEDSFYKVLIDLMFDDVYVNYSPQLVSPTATFNSNELNALKAFANISNNNDALDWLDLQGNIDTEKLQNNAMLEKRGNDYRVTVLDISDTEVEGTLDLSAFTELEELYCEDTEITSLNLSGCNKLETLECSNCEISNLTLPTGTSSKMTKLYTVRCENNHINIDDVFTNTKLENILFKPGATVEYKHQIFNAPVSSFNEDDYAALCAFANQGDNLTELGWDLTKPGEFPQVNWKLNTSTNKYDMFELDLAMLDVSGNIDLSDCAALEDYSFSGSGIQCVELPASDVPEYAFYDCENLEAVIVNTGTDEIGDSAFYYDNALTDVYYRGTSNDFDITVNDGNAAFTDADAHYTTDATHPHSGYTGTVTAPATCTTDGAMDVNCLYCGSLFVKTIPAGHTVAIDEAIEATCTTTGLTEGSHCSVCNTILTAQEVIPALGHDYESTVAAPTCTEQGYTTYTCTRCNDSYVDNYVSALGHSWGEWQSGNNGTTRSRSCSACGETENYTGWLQQNSNWYYYDETGTRVTGWEQINGSWYYFNSNGIMQTGWQYVNGHWYYMNSSGVMQTGWVHVNSKWYYMNQYGAMQYSWQEINGKWYYFNQNGEMVTGWLHYSTYWYYFDSDGSMHTGWLQLNGNWYYLDPENGRMATGTRVINGSTYYFDSNGVCQNPYNPQGAAGQNELMGNEPAEPEDLTA